MFLDRLSESVSTICQLDPSKYTLVGFSGGADSLTLLSGLQRLGYSLVAAHFDHGLRPDSAKDANDARAAAEKIGIQFICERGDVASLAKAVHLSIEEAARIARYRFLFAQARRLEVQAVAVGHTADDQCETVLMHFLRGSGITGLRGMRPRAVLPEWDAEIPLVRPLLGTWRKETQAFCKDNGLEPVADPSNNQTTFFRNRLRKEVLPYLEEFNPEIKAALLRMAEIMSGEEEILADAEAKAVRVGVLTQGTEYTTLEIPVLIALPAGLQRRLVRLAAGRLVPGLRDFDFDTSERVLRYAKRDQTGRPLDLVGGLRAYRENEVLYIALPGAELPTDGLPQLKNPGQFPLFVPGRIQLKHGLEITADLIDPFYLDDLPESPQPDEAWLDAEVVSAGLTVRNMQPGDRFQPLGMEKGTTKVSDLFTNEKVPQRIRRLWPLVFSGERLAWITGCRTAEFGRVTSDSKRVVYLRLMKPN